VSGYMAKGAGKSLVRVFASTQVTNARKKNGTDTKAKANVLPFSHKVTQLPKIVKSQLAHRGLNMGELSESQRWLWLGR